MKKLNVACFQLCSSENVEKNIVMIDKMFESIDKKLDLVCLPECAAIFTDSKKKLDNYYDRWHEKFMNFIKEKAEQNKTHVLVGSIPYRKKNLKFLNRSIIIDSDGIEKDYYDKINLFDVKLSSKEKYLESKNYDSGNIIKVARLPYGKIGLTICYDVRFPNLYRELAKKGADFISIPAAFTYTTGLAHWHSLIRARAIENGCFVFAPAQVGNHENGRKTYGHSMIVDPWGKVISSATDRKGIIYAKIDPTLVRKSREKIPSMTSFL